ncbi:MAG: phage Gp37/Gp68 family protein [Bacteroidota bacterium]
MSKSSIEWTGFTWNPTTGCTKISAGCKLCYALVMSKRLQYMGQKKYENGFKLTIHQDELLRPFTWKKPSVVFVNSMSDLFHEDVPLEFIKQVFLTMNATPQHTYQILTKRAKRLAEISSELTWTNNIWMGVSIEDERVVERLKYLKKSGAKIKFLSLEPLLGPLSNLNLKGIDWVITGGESGHGARPLKKEWVVDIKRQCAKQKVKFFFKQWGKKQFNPNPNDPTMIKGNPSYAKGGCELNGKIYRAMPIIKN